MSRLNVVTINRVAREKRLRIARQAIYDSFKKRGSKWGKGKPNLPKCLFWEYRFDEIRWRKAGLIVIERVLERGNDQEYEEVIRFYGKQVIVGALKKEIKYFPDYIIPRICAYFNLDEQQLACYEKKKNRTAYCWI